VALRQFAQGPATLKLLDSRPKFLGHRLRSARLVAAGQAEKKPRGLDERLRQSKNLALQLSGFIGSLSDKGRLASVKTIIISVTLRMTAPGAFQRRQIVQKVNIRDPYCSERHTQWRAG
jgi:hypothetical protein